jgi:hypothetical protein
MGIQEIIFLHSGFTVNNITGFKWMTTGYYQKKLLQILLLILAEAFPDFFELLGCEG